jgi:hypothetical protein
MQIPSQSPPNPLPILPKSTPNFSNPRTKLPSQRRPRKFGPSSGSKIPDFEENGFFVSS